MGSTLRIIFAPCFALFLLSGCSLFNDTVENCEEPQEYQESVSIPPLVVPKYLKNIQNKSNFNIPKIQGGNEFAEENFVIPMASAKSQSIAEQNNQMGIIEGDELSELLQLIDQTISNRQVGGQFQPIYENITSDYESNPSLEPCLDGPPKYFSEKISPRSIPSQTYTQSSDVSDDAEEEKSRRQKRREKRQKQRTGEQEQTGPSKEDAEEPEESKLESIWKAIGSAVLGIYAGGSAEGTSFGVGQSIVPPKPIRPDGTEEILVEDEQSQNNRVLAEQIRNLAALNPLLSDDQRAVILNMPDEQIMEMVDVVMGETQNQDSTEGIATDEEMIEEKEAKLEEDGWFTRVKHQWTEGKAQREERREARQKQRAERQAEDD